MTNDQQQLVLGTLLGNSKIKKDTESYFLIMKSNDKSWMDSKADALSEYGLYRWRQNSNYYWRSRSLPEFEPFYNTFYKPTKHATMDVLDRLNGIGLMAWYGDVGCVVGRNRQHACLRTQNLKDTACVVNQFFNEIGMTTTLNKVRERDVVVFSKDATKKFMIIIMPYLPESRYHLIPTINF